MATWKPRPRPPCDPAAICRWSLAIVVLLWNAEVRAVDLEPNSIPADVAAALAERTPQNVAQLRAIQRQLQSVLPQILAATVAVQAGRSVGSGVAIDQEGLILTSAHVFGRPGRKVQIVFPDGRRLSGRTLGANHDDDSGLIKLDNPPADLPVLPISWDRTLLPGEWVVTTGQPGGIVSDRSPPVRLGRVLFAERDLVCTDCTLVGGDSGGPLCNLRGEVVGVHSSIGPRVTHNFHVPLTAFRTSWERLMAGELWGGQFDDPPENEGRPMLGVTGRTSAGRCTITQVFPETPAALAGLRPGDVVVAADESKLETFEGLIKIVASKRPGQHVRLSVMRGEELYEFDVVLAGIGEPLPGSEP